LNSIIQIGKTVQLISIISGKGVFMNRYGKYGRCSGTGYSPDLGIPRM